MNNDKTTTTLTESCREESKRYRRGGHSVRKGACYELFRRAIVEKDQKAWAAVYEQYKRLVAKQLVTKGVQINPDQVDDLVEDTFAKFWQAMKSKEFANDFKSMGQIITYLKMCAHSVKVDWFRNQKKWEDFTTPLEEAEHIKHDPISSKIEALDREKLQTYFRSRLKDKEERLVFFLSFESGLKPRQIYAKYTQEFENVKEVRRIKERIVLRLKNDPQLRILWEALN